MQDYNEDIVIEQLQNPATVRQAFARVVARYSEPLYWQIRKMVLSHDDANDLLQNTFLKAWGCIEYFRGDAKLSTWLYRIAEESYFCFCCQILSVYCRIVIASSFFLPSVPSSPCKAIIAVF